MNIVRNIQDAKFEKVEGIDMGVLLRREEGDNCEVKTSLNAVGELCC